MKKLLSLSLLALMCASVFAQQVVLTFTGRDADNHFLPLSRVVISNQTRGWQETIYYPDTTLSFGATGISDYAANGSFGLAQNNPNPFNGTTDVNLTVTEPGAVTMEIADVNGKIVETYGRASLQPGTHQFRINVANAGVYFLTARQNGKTSSVKMVNNGNGAGNGIEYVGTVGTVCTPSLPTKNGEKGHTDNPFSIGDEMVYIGYAIVNGTEYASQTIHQNQLGSETFVLNFNVAYVEPTGLATVTTDTVSDITGSSAICTGTVVDDGGDSVIARGVCWSTSQNPTTADNHTTDGNGTGSFTSSITGLSANTTYYVRAYATNSVGTAYGEIRSFTIADPCNPYLVGRVASTSSAIDGSDLTETIVEHTTSTDTTSQFEFFVRKNCTDCDTKISLEVDLYVLEENGNESLMGNVNDYANLSFASYLDNNYTQWTPADASSISIPGHYVSFNGISQRANYFNLCYADPDYSCNPVSRVTPASIAALPYYGPDYAGVGTPNLGRVHGIKVSSWRQAGTYKFVIRLVRRDDATAYALTTRDWCLENQLGGHGADLTSLVYDTLTFWVYVDTATNDGQPCPGTPTLTDVDGNTYNTVQIGNQCWMKENLRTDVPGNNGYPDGDANNWEYGRLYSWDVMMNGAPSSNANPSNVQGICPDGWHVPSDAEWTQLTDYVSSQSEYVCGSNNTYIAKALAGTTGWCSSYTTCAVGNTPSNNNATGFSALPAGYYYYSYGYFGGNANFWSATETSSYTAYNRNLYCDDAGVNRNIDNKTIGFSVRCVRD